MSELRLFIPIGKVDEAKRIVYGTLTAEVPDKSGEMFDYASGKPAVQAWSDEIKAATNGKSLGNVRAMHDKIAAGKFTDIVYDDDAKSIQGAAKIVDDDEWNKVVEGVYTGFSIGGWYTRRWQDPKDKNIWRFTPELTEVSLVDNPCVPTATFEYVKADGSVELRKFNHQSQEDIMTTNAGGIAATPTPDELLKAAEEAVAAGTATDDQKALLAKRDEKPVLVQDGKPVKPKAAPVQKNVWLASDGTEHANKRAAEVHELGLEKAAELAPALGAMNDLLAKAKKPADEDEDAEGDDEETKTAKKARRDEKAAKAKKEADDKEKSDKAANDKAAKDDAEMAAKAKKDKEDADKAAADALGKKDYSDDERKAMAGKEAMDDGSFPIKTKKDLENAIKAFGRAKDKDAAKKHIVARAKALKLTDELPADWEGSTKKKEADKSTASEMSKSMHDVARTACMIDELTWLKNGVKMEEAMEDDDASKSPAAMEAIIEQLCAYLKDRVAEETDELVAQHSDDDEDDILEMSAGLPVGHIDRIAKFVATKAEPLLKSDSKTDAATGERLSKFAAALEKAGARHSKADMERLQSVHDGLDEMHKCMGDMVEKCAGMHKAAGEMKNTAIDMGADGQHVEPDDEEDNRGAQKAAKAFEALNAKSDEVLAITKLAASQNATLLKAIPLIEGLQRDLQKERDEKAELAKRVDHLERQPAAAKGHGRAISKTQDTGGEAGETEADYQARLAKMSPAQRNRELMKLAMSNPMELPAL